MEEYVDEHNEQQLLHVDHLQIFFNLIFYLHLILLNVGDHHKHVNNMNIFIILIIQMIQLF